MSETITFVDFDDWHMVFAGDDVLVEGHTIYPAELTRKLMDVDYDSTQAWQHQYGEDVDFVEYTDQIPQYLKKHGISVLFDDE